MCEYIMWVGDTLVSNDSQRNALLFDVACVKCTTEIILKQCLYTYSDVVSIEYIICLLLATLTYKKFFFTYGSVGVSGRLLLFAYSQQMQTYVDINLETKIPTFTA